MKNRTVLSIDWDYFFPDEIEFDWAHSEVKHMAFMFEGIWQIRAFNHNMKGQRAIDIFNPTGMENFWEKVCPIAPNILVIAESHENLAELLAMGDIVYNFDAHHDCGYHCHDDPTGLDCGSWAKTSDISEYHLVYPAWRRQASEFGDDSFGYVLGEEQMKEADLNSLNSLRPMKVYYEIPAELPKFEMVFICRSSAWTPPWADKHWMEFISYWKQYKRIWAARMKSPYASKRRLWDNEAAQKIQDDFEVKMNEFRNASDKAV